MTADHSLRVIALCGSMRDDNMTMKALGLVCEELRSMEGVELDLVDPRELRLGLPGQVIGHSDADDLRQRILDADAVLFATPEYHGSYSSVTKMLIENMGFPNALGGKPVALLGVAAGVLGATKALEHLRSILAHVGALALPRGVSLAKVNELFGADGELRDEEIGERLRALARSLVEFARVQQG